MNILQSYALHYSNHLDEKTSTRMRPIGKYRLIAAFVLLGSNLTVFGQGFYNPTAWKSMRHEFFVGAGAANFMGELGGLDKIGSEFLWDFEVSMTQPCARVGYMYYLAERWGFKSTYHWGILAGNDNLTQELFRRNRNLHFKSHIHEVALQLEWQFMKEKVGNIYRLHNKKGRKIGQKALNLGMYLNAGVSGFYFNPKAKYNGSWVALQPLGTEGQGLEGRPGKYSRFSIGFPVGFGFRSRIGEVWTLSLDFSYRFTLTDYIDDVSTEYYDNDALRAANGDAAADLADPSIGLPESGWPEGGYIAGQQRGDPTDRDGYMFVTLNLHYRQYAYKRKRRKGRRYRRVRAYM